MLFKQIILVTDVIQTAQRKIKINIIFYKILLFFIYFFQIL